MESGAERLTRTGPGRAAGPTVEQIRAFVAVADHGSLRVAAEVLDASTDRSVGRLVARLADALGRGPPWLAPTTAVAR